MTFFSPLLVLLGEVMFSQSDSWAPVFLNPSQSGAFPVVLLFFSGNKGGGHKDAVASPAACEFEVMCIVCMPFASLETYAGRLNRSVGSLSINKL